MFCRFIVACSILCVGCARGESPSHNNPQPDISETPPVDGDLGTRTKALSGDGSVEASTGSIQNEPEQWTGIRGVVKVLEGQPQGSVYLSTPGTKAPPVSAAVDAEGRFWFPALEPNTYRLVVPADGLHATSDMYVTVDPTTKRAAVTIPRSRGCPVTIAVRDHKKRAISGATVSLTLTDLPDHIPAPHKTALKTGTDGKAIVVGSCVRGFFDGEVTAPGHGTYKVRHGYLGSGYDQFDVVLPELPDGTVTYENDD